MTSGEVSSTVKIMCSNMHTKCKYGREMLCVSEKTLLSSKNQV